MGKSMGVLTAGILLLLAGYVGAMMTGSVATDFEWLLFLCTVVTGVYWLADRFYFSRQRAVAWRRAQAAGAHQAGASRQLLAQPWWLEYTAGFFPVVLFVFLLRSFVVEPFRIPSDSMVPTLEDGDLILVKKYAYGLRLPMLDTKIWSVGSPQRGDVVVFRYPLNVQQDYIKRVVGLPGDYIEYTGDKRLIINGIEVRREPIERYFYERRGVFMPQQLEWLGETKHRVSIANHVAMRLQPDFAHTDPQACRYGLGNESVVCTVPPGKYFVMGDNRDNSQDSRIWGFVPQSNIKGHAFFIWMNFGNIGRIGSFD